MSRPAYVESDTVKRVRRGYVTVDSRGRCNLARVREYVCDRYLVEELPDGTLILTPAMVVPIAEWQRRQAYPRFPGGVAPDASV